MGHSVQLAALLAVIVATEFGINDCVRLGIGLDLSSERLVGVACSLVGLRATAFLQTTASREEIESFLEFFRGA